MNIESARITSVTASQVGNARTSCTWEWETASSFADSGPRRRPGEETWTNNQTVFLCGFKVSIRSFPLKKSAKAPFTFCHRDRVVQGVSFGILVLPTVREHPTLKPRWKDFWKVPRFVYHPSNAINEYLLQSSPSVDVAVTHDDDWASCLTDDSGDPSLELKVIQEPWLVDLRKQILDKQDQPTSVETSASSSMKFDSNESREPTLVASSALPKKQDTFAGAGQSLNVPSHSFNLNVRHADTHQEPLWQQPADSRVVDHKWPHVWLCSQGVDNGKVPQVARKSHQVGKTASIVKFVPESKTHRLGRHHYAPT
ncbi:hypothetical protein DFH07DRAFT_767059 [Mycena maculata]|uniref:Uncharacterized protein n=1 Tax=Mycena maculata TaxID=230809 RepID=A0AAD7NUJ5_9AGAR|nr:hypothetical protein DFH07DRAFT_767059 [Mycena maculata]